MLSKRTIIGLVVGSAIIGIGAYSLILHIGIITINEDHFVETGGSASYIIPAPEGAVQSMKITGDSFNVTLSSPETGLPIPETFIPIANLSGHSLASPETGLQIPETPYSDEAQLDWIHAKDGDTRIRIENTGGTTLEITGVLNRSSDPIWFTYDLMVIISGMVIIGFSMGFTLRRPKGF